MVGISVLGIVLILVKKIPVLVELPEASAPVLSNVFKERAERVAPDFSGFSPEKFLQKVLSKSKVFILRAEHKVDGQLRKLRRKNKSEKKDFVNDEYWDELKKGVDDDENVSEGD